MMRQSSFLSGLCIGVGIVLGAVFVSKSMDNHTYYSRSISVKGLSEKDIEADEGLWTLTIALSGNDVVLLHQKAEHQKKTVADILLKEGFLATEINVDTAAEVNDKKLNQYGEFDELKQSRYVLNTRVVVNTKRVSKLFKATRILNQLLKDGIYFKGETQPSFFYTKLNDIKPNMLKEAGENAHKAALELANNTNSKVGKIKTATQGVFSIRLRADTSEFQGGFAKSSPYLRARVVTHVTYFIAD